MNTEQEPQAQAGEPKQHPAMCPETEMPCSSDACAEACQVWRDAPEWDALRKFAEKDAALNACVEAMENIKSDYAAHDGKRWDIDDAITQAEKALK